MDEFVLNVLTTGMALGFFLGVVFMCLKDTVRVRIGR